MTFFSFVPTDYTGVADLGLIAGFGMAIALVLNLTLLPALLTLLRPAGERHPIGFRPAVPVGRFLVRRRWWVLGIAGAVALAAAALQTSAIPASAIKMDVESLVIWLPNSLRSWRALRSYSLSS